MGPTKSSRLCGILSNRGTVLNVLVSHLRRIGSYLTGEIWPNGTHLRCGVRTLRQILVVDIRRHLSVRHMTLFFSPSMHPSFSIICLFLCAYASPIRLWSYAYPFLLPRLLIVKPGILSNVEGSNFLDRATK